MRRTPLFVPRAAGLAPRRVDPRGPSGKNSYMAGGATGASVEAHEE